MKRGFFQSLQSLGFCVLLMGVLSGCSLDMFSSKPKDDAITRQKNYREGKPGCASFSIPETGLDPKSFRGLIDCFNANGSIKELHALVKKADDRTLIALTRLLNDSFFRNPDQIGETYVFFQYLDKSKRLNPSVESVTKLFENADSIAAVFQFLDVARESTLSLNPTETASVAKWFNSISPQSFELYLGAVEKVMRSQAWVDVRSAFTRAPLTAGEKTELKKALHAWVTGPGEKNTASLDLFRAFAQGKGKLLFDVLLEDAKASGRLLEKMFTATGGSRAWLDSFESLRSGLSSPITCMGGSLKYKDPWQELLGELKRNKGEGFYNFSVRVGSTQTLILRECCKIPDAVLNSYESMLGMFAGSEGTLLSRSLESGVQAGLGEKFGEWMDRDSDVLSPVFRIFVSRGVSSRVLELLSSLSDSEWSQIGKSLDEFVSEGHVARIKAWTARLEDADFERIGDLLIAISGGTSASDHEKIAIALGEIRTLFRESDRHSWWEGIRKIVNDSLEGKTDFMTLSELSRLPEFKPAVKMLYTMGQDDRLSAMLFDLVRLFASTLRTLSTSVMTAEKWPDESKNRFTFTAQRKYAMPGYARACSALKLSASIESQKRNFYDCMGSNQGAKELEEWVSALEKRTAGNGSGSTLAQSVFSRVIALLKVEFKSDSKARWVGDVFRTKALPTFLGSLSDLNSYGGGKISNEIRGVFSKLLAVPAALDRFLSRLNGYFKSAAFLDVNRWIQEADRTPTPPRVPVRFRGATDEMIARKMLQEKECVAPGASVDSRVAELDSDIQNAIVGWESVRDRSRQSWDEKTLVERIGALKPYLGDPVVAEGLRRLFLELQARVGARGTLDWFEKRSLDIKPVMYIFPGEKEARVRYMSTLDRLEVLLTAADFKFATWLFEDNFALKFIAQIGDSWGDEPRENWPIEIRKKYDGSRQPPTLSETYDDIQGFLKRFSNLGGLPKVGKCASAREDDPLITAPSALVPFWVKANLYNLKQVLPVYEENLPGAPGTMKDGMKFLRDLFFFIDVAGRDEDRDPSKADRNPLSIIRALGRLGFLRTSSLYFSFRDPSNRSRDEAALNLAMKLAGSSAFAEVFTTLMKGAWENTPMKALSELLFRINRSSPSAIDDFTAGFIPTLALGGEFLSDRAGVDAVARAILDSGILTRPSAVAGAVLFAHEMTGERFSAKLWKTRASVSSESREKVIQLLTADPQFLKTLLTSITEIFERPDARATIVDASRSSELRRLKTSIDALFPKSTWVGGTSAADEELGLVVRSWLGASLPVLLPDLMRFHVQDSKSFNQFLSSLARFSESQSFGEIQDLFSRHLPR